MINLFKYYVDMENCESFKGFDYIYIYIYELFCYIIGILQCEARLGFFSFPSENPQIDLFFGGGGRITCITSASKLQQNKRRPPMIGEDYATCLFAKIVFSC